MEKKEKKSRVFIKDTKSKNAVEIITGYKVLSYKELPDIGEGISNLEVTLYRTSCCGRRQIRNQHLQPSFGAKYQAFGILNYLRGKVIQVQPEYKLSKSWK